MDMSYNDTISEEDFELLLEDRAFVDYFNLYQSLPIFGQHVIYNFIEKEFSYEPPIKKERYYIDRREVICWLRIHRYPGFFKSYLFGEYVFSSRLRDIVQHLELKECDSKDRIFTRNLLGNAVGMQLFREFLIGTAGEKCYRCWLDLERIRRMPDGDERRKLMLYVRNMYLADGAPDELDSAGKFAVFEGKLNFDFIPEANIQMELIQTFGSGNVIYRVNSDEAFRDLQNIIVSAMKVYWVPRYVIHLMKTAPKHYLEVLNRETPHDKIAIEKQQQMKCKSLFPTDTTKLELTPTKVIESNVAGEMTNVQETPKFDRSNTTLTESSLSDTLASTSSVDYSFIEEEPTDHDEQEEILKHSDFLTIAGGGQLEKRYVSPLKTQSLDFGSSADPRDLTSSFKTMSVQTVTPPFTFIGPLPKIPPSMSTYISGTKRINTGRKATGKVMIALAAEKLAGNPLQSYLYESRKTREIRLLEFWTHVRQYLDADDSHRDEFGHLIRRKLAHTIFNQYLSAGRDNVLPEAMKMTVFMSITREDDASLLCSVQDFVTERLKDTVKQFMTVERKAFRKAVRMDRRLLGKVSECEEDMEKYEHSPLQGETPDIIVKDSRKTIDGRLPSRASESSIPMTLTDEHIMKAFEFTVILTEYGRLGIFSYQTPDISNIIDVLYSDYGSLHIHKIATTRNTKLNQLTSKHKINIGNIKVSRQVFLEGKGFRGRAECDKPKGIRRIVRREGLVIERPAKPRTFSEVLNSQLHYEFFKRYMMGEKTIHPLTFWKSIEELRDMPPGRKRQARTRNIIRRNFSKKAKHGAFLDCNDDIVKQIPFMEKVPISVLECAQASVYRSMEKKWFPRYLATYPPDPGEEAPPEIQALSKENLENVEEKPKKKKKQKTLVLWQKFVSTIMCFLKSIRQDDEIKLLNLFLKKQIQKALIRQMKQYQALFKNEADKEKVNPSNAQFEARILLKNRLVILDKLPGDLRFFGEVTKYVGQVDHIFSLENISQESMDFLNDKAREMVNCFLVSDILPQNQLNIPEELAQNIILSLENEGATRGLFHDAFILIFPILYHYWRQCQRKWLKHHTASELIGLIEKKNKMQEKPTTPNKCVEVPDFLRLRESQMKIATQFMPGDEQFIINFSLRDGCKKFIPVPKVQQLNNKDRRSVTGRRTSMMGRRPSLLGRRTSLSMKQSSKSIRGSETTISDTSPTKEKEKEKSVSKSISTLMKKMQALADEGSPGSKSPASDKANSVDDLIEKSAHPPNRVRKINDLVSAAVQDDIDEDLFGDD
ncbi:Hypothetical predicted protein [Mytilus galloprovincialis]|uniref:RGS domain-containing protein n=1 Tax=Mytilus galloprovincialis TaxID=29158 RepID=A0A8B6DZL0_MYTGA|nr:Hypothetical predicted protein [Mytilus galloprovincialis]